MPNYGAPWLYKLIDYSARENFLRTPKYIKKENEGLIDDKN